MSTYLEILKSECIVLMFKNVVRKSSNKNNDNQNNENSGHCHTAGLCDGKNWSHLKITRKFGIIHFTLIDWKYLRPCQQDVDKFEQIWGSQRAKEDSISAYGSCCSIVCVHMAFLEISYSLHLLYLMKSVHAKLSSITLQCIITKAATYMNRGRSKRTSNDMDQSIDGWNVPS